jgi:hypothetical protein
MSEGSDKAWLGWPNAPEVFQRIGGPIFLAYRSR